MENKENKKIKVIELFAGMGSPAKALKRLNIEHEVIDAIEIDKNAMKAYNAIHGTNFVVQDIKTWDKDIECDYLHASTPCQAFSTAGKNIGEEDERGKVLWEHTLRIIKKTKPKFITMENVKGLVSQKHKKLLDWYLGELEQLGYISTWRILNSKDFGIPQNRERVFIMSSKEEPCFYEKSKIENKTLCDILDRTKKYITTQNFKFIGNKVYFENLLSQYNGKIVEIDRDLWEKQEPTKINKVATIKQQDWATFDFDKYKELEDLKFNSAKSFNGVNGIVGTLRASPDAKHEQKLIDVSFQQDKHFLSIFGLSGALTTTSPDFKNKIVAPIMSFNLIGYRKLSTLEVIRLMGFDDDDYEKMLKELSESQICKIAGNSIVVNVMEYVIWCLLVEKTFKRKWTPK